MAARRQGKNPSVAELEARIEAVEDLSERLRQVVLQLCEHLSDRESIPLRQATLGQLAAAQADSIGKLGRRRRAAEAPMATAAAERAACDWIRTQAQGSRAWKKGKAWEACRSAVPGKLSQRAFDRAWAAEAPPEWKAGGRRKD